MPNPTLLKKYAKSFPVYDGQVIVHMMPYMTPRYDVVLSALERAHMPRYRYIHDDGQVSAVIPEELRTAREYARLTNAPDTVYTGWKEEWAWGNSEALFMRLEADCVDIEFHWQEGALASLRSLQAYWDNRTDDIAENWALFSAIVSVSAYTVPIYVAYNATREKVTADPALAEKPEVPPDDADPKS